MRAHAYGPMQAYKSAYMSCLVLCVLHPVVIGQYSAGNKKAVDRIEPTAFCYPRGGIIVTF